MPLCDYGIKYLSYSESTVHSLNGEERAVTLNLGGLLAFITGADRLPPMGFSDVPLLQFNHDPTFRLPVVSTCTPSLILPTTHNASYKTSRVPWFRASLKDLDLAISKQLDLHHHY